MNLLGIKKIKILLVFFCGMACTEGIRISQVDLRHADNKAVGVVFTTNKRTADTFEVALKASKTPVFGKLSSTGNQYTFTPVVPFTEQQTYEIRVGGKPLVEFLVPSRQRIGTIPELTHIFPSTDTVPENLLKMHFHFSTPMQEVGRALDFITVTEDSSGTVVDVFLEMETELWNKAHDQLTLWLDPGRIKTDLIPNREKGLPLTEGKSYTIKIDSRWKAANGNPLGSGYTKRLQVIARDSQRPSVKDWQLQVPKKNTRHALQIGFNGALDAELAQEAISVTYAAGGIVEGTYKLLENESVLAFAPDANWSAGSYQILVEGHLEDLAGNNLDRLFDTDVTQVQKGQANDTTARYTRNFSIP